jgi:hypothetical protein
MIANLQLGERIVYTIFTGSKSVRVEGEVTQIERKHNLGRIWTTHGALPWQPLTAKYELRLCAKAEATTASNLQSF